MNDVEANENTDPRRWEKNGWIATIVKNEDDDGWAVEMTRIGDTEPVLVGPWTMGRDKKSPKPLDSSSFLALVKGANEVLRRHEQAALARLHRSLVLVDADGRRLRADLDVAHDDDDPHAMLTVVEEVTDVLVRRGRVGAGFQLSTKSVLSWLANVSSAD